jgi:hypothetical protein
LFYFAHTAKSELSASKDNKVGNKPIVKTITKIGAVFQTISQQGKQENFIHQ